ncbi:MAG TPA: hypothetical protein VGR48_13665 [Terriglobales bacterium]|nr:hypothetical protein [Terriglobales bacterium]
MAHTFHTQPRRKPPTSETIAAFHDLVDQIRNEQQKAILLTEVARLRGKVRSKELRRQMIKLLTASHDLRRRSKNLRYKKSA